MKITTKKITAIGLTAALYTALTLAFSGLAYGEIQFRFSEVLNLLAFINPVFAPGIVLGCFISNLFSPNGALLDGIIGTFATVVTMVGITKLSKNLMIAAVWPVVCCVFIGMEILYLSGAPFTFANLILPSVTVMAGEAAVMIIGYFMFNMIMKNNNIINMLKNI